MSDADLNAICDRLTMTLREIVERMKQASERPGPAEPMTGHASLAEAAAAASQLRAATHSKAMAYAGATAGL